jgi:hypothetical protein
MATSSQQHHNPSNNITEERLLLHKTQYLYTVLFFFIECTGTAFRHLFSTDFQSFNPIESFGVQGSSHDFLAYKYNTIQIQSIKFMLRTEYIFFLIKD